MILISFILVRVLLHFLKQKMNLISIQIGIFFAFVSTEWTILILNFFLNFVTKLKIQRVPPDLHCRRRHPHLAQTKVVHCDLFISIKFGVIHSECLCWALQAYMNIV